MNKDIGHRRETEENAEKDLETKRVIIKENSA